MPESKHVDRFGAALHVHHVVPAAEIDDAEERNSLDNLIPLCCRCHCAREWSDNVEGSVA